MLIPSTCTPSSARSLASATRSGASARQGAHAAYQVLSTTTSPSHALVSTCSPS
ncbi:Uncharacterised protein [Mycobacteroides abscessus]|nr:Uncharacterised protein [Mycobacteroides abscessus]